MLFIHTLRRLHFSLVWRRNVFPILLNWELDDKLTNGEIPQVSDKKNRKEKGKCAITLTRLSVSSEPTRLPAEKIHAQCSTWVNVQIYSLETGRCSKPSEHSVMGIFGLLAAPILQYNMNIISMLYQTIILFLRKQT